MLTSVQGRFAGLTALLFLACCTSPNESSGPPAPRPVPKRPLVVAFEGQSNMQGQGDSTLSPDLPAGQAREFIFTPTPTLPLSGHLRNGLSDPMSRNVIISSRSNTGSLIPVFAQKVATATGRQVIACMTAVQGSYLFVPPGGSSTDNWLPGKAYQTMADDKITAMLAQAECPDSLDLIVTMLGETDFTNVVRYHSDYRFLPDSMVVTPADSIPSPSGGYLNYPAPRGYPNAHHLKNVYTNFRTYYKNRMDRWHCRMVVIGTGLMQCNTPAHQAGGRMAGPIQRLVVKHLQAEGYPIAFVRGAEKLDAMGCQRPCPDGLHYTQQGYNYLGEWAAKAALRHVR